MYAYYRLGICSLILTFNLTLYTFRYRTTVKYFWFRFIILDLDALLGEIT